MTRTPSPPSYKRAPEGAYTHEPILGSIDNPINAIIDKIEEQLIASNSPHGLLSHICHPSTLLAHVTSATPVVICNVCLHCQYSRKFFHVGNEVFLGSCLGNGIISRVVRFDGGDVIFEVKGRNITTPLNTAYVRAPRRLARLNLADSLCYRFNRPGPANQYPREHTSAAY